MTGRIHSVESFGTVDGPGIRFVIFMQGCPMRCKYCHNPDTWNFAGGREARAEDLAAEAYKYRRYFADKGGVTASGGEPLMQIPFLIELFTILKEKKISTCVDTSGIAFTGGSEQFEKLLSLTDLFLLDVKHIDEEAHRALTGRSGENPRAFARYLSEKRKPVWIRHVLVPGITDDDGALIRTREFIDSLSNVEKVEVLPYHTMGEIKYRRLGIDYPLAGIAPPSGERVENARRILGADRGGIS